MKIVNEQRGSSIAQFFTIQTMELDPRRTCGPTVTGDLHTIVGNKVVSSERRILPLRLAIFRAVPEARRLWRW